MHLEGNHLIADENKQLYCLFNERYYGSDVYLGYVYYDKDRHELPEPYLLTITDFIEIEIEIDNKEEEHEINLL